MKDNINTLLHDISSSVSVISMCQEVISKTSDLEKIHRMNDKISTAVEKLVIIIKKSRIEKD
jgi:hypothetical protein